MPTDCAGDQDCNPRLWTLKHVSALGIGEHRERPNDLCRASMPNARKTNLGIGPNAVCVRPPRIACYNFLTLAGLRERLIQTLRSEDGLLLQTWYRYQPCVGTCIRQWVA
jgi:hypothetical protein